jgi:hypothetical protein
MHVKSGDLFVVRYSHVAGWWIEQGRGYYGGCCQYGHIDSIKWIDLGKL